MGTPPSRIRWAPQAGPQTALVNCPVREIFAGGARGGGKTDGIVGRVGIRAQLFGRHYNAVVFRREMPQSDDLIDRAEEVWSPLGRLNRSTSTFKWDNGARTRFRPLERVSDASKYQGQNLVDAVVEEAGNYPDKAPIMRLFGALRSAKGIPTSLLLTGNPGGPGQLWIKERYIDPAPAGMQIIREKNPDGSISSRVFIPASVRDNKILLENDPLYISNLYQVGSAGLVRAWLEGDWNAVESAFFDCWQTENHTCRPFELPRDGLRFRSIDWGSAQPFSIGWWWVAPDDYYHPVTNRRIRRGTMVRYREWYGCDHTDSSKGLKLPAPDVAARLLERQVEGEDELIDYTVADPSMFAEPDGPSIAERMANAGVICRPGENKRVGDGRGHLGGWDVMRQRMLDRDPETDDYPAILCFNTCKDSVRTIPVLQHDPDKPEDLLTAKSGEVQDHAADEWRYACMSRPWSAHQPKHRDPIEAAIEPLTFDEMIDQYEATRSRDNSRL